MEESQFALHVGQMLKMPGVVAYSLLNLLYLGEQHFTLVVAASVLENGD